MLRIQSLSVKLPRSNQLLLTGINLQLAVRECLALIGPNGCGKSTLLKTIVGQLSYCSGAIYLDGKPLSIFKRYERAQRIALLAQHDDIEPCLSVIDYVSLGRLPYHNCCSTKQNHYFVTQALDETNTTALTKMNLGELSGGQRQRVALARIFAQTPKLILLDELTNHLDPLARINLLSLVRAKGVAVIAVLHDLPLVESFAHKVCVMESGKIVICDTADKALHSSVIRPVFGMQSFTVQHPKKGDLIHLFEAAGQ